MKKNESFERAMKKRRRYIKMGGRMEIEVASKKIACESEEQLQADMRKFLEESAAKAIPDT